MASGYIVESSEDAFFLARLVGVVQRQSSWEMRLSFQRHLGIMVHMRLAIAILSAIQLVAGFGPARADTSAIAAAAPEGVATNAVARRDFLGFYSDHGLRYEYVKAFGVGDALSSGSNLYSENSVLRGRLGVRGSFDGATYSSGQGQQQVDSGLEVRTLRFYTSGDFFLFRTNQFKVDLGLANESFYLHEAYLRWPGIRHVGNLTVGYFGVPQTIENITSFGVNRFMEAASPGLAFSPGNRTGIQVDHSYFDERATASVGLFSIGQDPVFGSSDTSKSLARPTFRLTGLPIFEPDQHRLLHLGGSAAFVFSDSSEIQYQARPESHLAPVLVDTGSLNSRFAYVGGLEAIYQEGPFSLQSEVMGSSVSADENYIFWGGYVAAGWFLTGERAPYDRAAAVPGKVSPESPLFKRRGAWGALELALRYSYLDLSDGNVNGGRMSILMPGLNWYWSDQIRCQFNYGFAHVEEGPSPGNLNIFQMRLQMDF